MKARLLIGARGGSGEDGVEVDRFGAQGLVRRMATWPVVIVSGLCFIVFAGVLFTSSAPFAIPTVEDVCGAAPLDVRPYSNSDDVNRFLANCGEDGRAAYRNLQIADLFYPAVYGVFMTSILALTLRRLFPERHVLTGLAFIALVGTGFDYLENAFAWWALATYPDVGISGSLLGFASSAKTVTSWFAGIMLLAGLGLLVVRAVMARLDWTRPVRPAPTLR